MGININDAYFNALERFAQDKKYRYLGGMDEESYTLAKLRNEKQ